MCSTLADCCCAGIAFSTGMTCIPMPEPPGGTIGVTFSRGSRDIFSKNSAMTGCSSVCFLFIIMNSAQPGTNIGSTYCLCLSAFSQLYSIIPMTDISSRSCCTRALSLPDFFAICSSVMGFLTFIARQTSAISSVSTSASPQYSGSSTVTLCPIRSVIICPSFRIRVLSSLIYPPPSIPLPVLLSSRTIHPFPRPFSRRPE